MEELKVLYALLKELMGNSPYAMAAVVITWLILRYLEKHPITPSDKYALKQDCTVHGNAFREEMNNHIKQLEDAVDRVSQRIDHVLALLAGRDK